MTGQNDAMIRKTIFWMHLICGVLTGLVVLMMSVTGVLLTYERQMLAWANHRGYEAPEPGTPRLPIPAILAAVRVHAPDFTATSIALSSDPDTPAVVSAGRSGQFFVDPYRGTVIGDGAERLDAFFSAVTGWHRWFNVTGDGRTTARAITGASNLVFLFLIFSGMYLWLPPVFKAAAFRIRLLFDLRPRSGKVRDFNWHHVFGIWSAMPLAVVVATASVFSYGWANDLVYRLYGEEPPAGGRGGGPPPVMASQPSGSGTAPPGSGTAPLTLDDLFERAAAHIETHKAGWRTITLNLPGDPAAPVSFSLDQGDGGQPQLRHAMSLHPITGAVVSWQPFNSQTPGRQARSYVRFLHTGEALGLAGQTIAGLVSLTSVFMVWTGLALAYRRLIVPLFRRRS